jgi:hypothetical protein
MFLNGLYPIPARDALEKRRRKWYQKNKDPDFDVNYNPEEAKQ